MLAIWWRHPNLGDSSPVAVPLVSLKANLFAEDQGAHPLLGPLPEGLCLFRSIDSGDTNLVLSLVGVKHRDGIAICNANNNTGHVSESW